jgi:hypothetical protein
MKLSFSDECGPTSDKYRNLMEWAMCPDDVTPLEMEQFAAGSVMVLGFIGHNYKKLLRIPKSTVVDRHGTQRTRTCVDTAMYQSLLDQVKGDLRKFDYFMQDGAGAHDKLKRSGYFKKNKINVLPWCARSPDLNPIETMWALVAQQMRHRALYGDDEVWAAFKEAWDAVPMATVNALVAEFVPRCEACVVRGGEVVRRQDVLPFLPPKAKATRGAS